MLKILLVTVYLTTPYAFAKMDYGIVIQKMQSRKFKSFIANFYGITPTKGEKLAIPFSKIDYCYAIIDNVKDGFLGATMLDCKYDYVKEGQNLILLRKRKMTMPVIKNISKKKITHSYGNGPLYFISGDLSKSIATVFIPETSSAPVGARYSTENILGAECNVKLIQNNGDIGIIDSSACSFEREFYTNQKFNPVKK